MRLLTFYIKYAADAQYPANMWSILFNNSFSHAQVMVQYPEEDGEVFASSCAGGYYPLAIWARLFCQWPVVFLQSRNV